MIYDFPHIQCNKGDVAPVVLMPSNPAKADAIATQLDDAKNLGRYREFVSWTGTYKGTPVSVISTGIGCPSVAIAVEEAVGAGARVLVRVGTCGGAWRADIPCGSLVVPTACTREEGTTVEYVPRTFPAVADFDAVQCIKQQAEALSLSVYYGINRTHDAYYGSSNNQQAWTDTFTSCRTDISKQPILSSEMECAAFYVLASLRGVRAVGVLAVNAHPEPLGELSSRTYVPDMKNGTKASDQSETDSIQLVLAALPALSAL